MFQAAEIAHEIVYLRSGDAVTVLCAPQMFFAYGATARSAEISFDTDGTTLAQARMKTGGLPSRNSFFCLNETSNQLPAPQPAPRMIIEKEPATAQACEQSRQRHGIGLRAHVTIEREVGPPPVALSPASIDAISIVMGPTATIPIVAPMIDEMAIVPLILRHYTFRKAAHE